MVRHIRAALLSSVLLVPLGAQAAEIRAEQSDFGTLQYPTLVVHIEGEVVEGDADRIQALLASHVTAKQRGIYFAFDSPGGNLWEGVRIGSLIAERSELTTALVGTPNNPNAICASACVFAFLGANTREKMPESRIGLHQFYLPENDLNGDEALGVGQRISAFIASYLAKRDASVEIFDRMVRTPPGQMDWVSDADLSTLGVLGGRIIQQRSEFINNRGKVALKMGLMSSGGEHTLLVGCNDPGVYVIASIVALDDTVSFSDAALILDDERVEPAHVEVAGFKDRRVVLLFVMSPALAVQATQATQIGSYYFDNEVKSWVGNMQDIDHQKFDDLIGSCVQ